MSKFKCNTCNKEHEISSFVVSVKNDKKIYRDKRTKEELKCDCKKKTVLEEIEDTSGGLCTTFGKYKSATPAERAKFLKKRSKEHFDKEIKEAKYEMLTNKKYDA